MTDSRATRALRRNRDFVLLQAGQLLSSAGSQATAIAYPLLVLSMSGSPAQAGLVSFTKLGILQQAGTSMLAQANQAPQGVLSLLR